MVSKDLYVRYQFFRENAGYCVGSRAAGALALARAEIWFEENEGIANWLWDDEPWDGDVPAPTEVLGCIVTVDGETTSLWGIGDPDESYVRVVVAELALELWFRLVEKIGNSVLSI